jgi:hypothetical protein
VDKSEEIEEVIEENREVNVWTKRWILKKIFSI